MGADSRDKQQTAESRLREKENETCHSLLPQNNLTQTTHDAIQGIHNRVRSVVKKLYPNRRFEYPTNPLRVDLQLDSHFIVHYVSGTIWYKEMTHEEGAKLQAKLHSEWKWPNDVPTDSGLAEVDADDITSQLMLPKWNFRNY